MRVDDFDKTNGAPHATCFQADMCTLTCKNVLSVPPPLPRSRMLDMAKNLKILISTEFFGFIQCYGKVNRRVKWHEGNQRFA